MSILDPSARVHRRRLARLTMVSRDRVGMGGIQRQALVGRLHVPVFTLSGRIVAGTTTRLQWRGSRRRAAVECAALLAALCIGTIALAWLSWTATVDRRLEAERRPSATTELTGSLQGDLTRATTEGATTEGVSPDPPSILLSRR